MINNFKMQYKLKFFTLSFSLFTYSSLAFLHLRFKFASKPFQVRFIEWAENGSCTEFVREVLKFIVHSA